MRYRYLGFTEGYEFEALDYNELKRKTVVVFGASPFGEITFRVLESRGVNVSCFCDNDKEKQKLPFCGLKVASVEELAEKFLDAFIFISPNKYPEIEAQLLARGFKNLLSCVSLLCSFELDDSVVSHSEYVSRMADIYISGIISNHAENKVHINSIDVVVTEKCSLRCKDCANLMQYYKNPADCDADILVDALNKIMASIDYVHEFRVLGGEPFMNKIMGEIIGRIARFDNLGRLVIYTNGTILPNDDTLSYLKNEKVEVSITSYKGLSTRAESLAEMLTQEGIKNYIMHCEKWQDCGRIEHHERTAQENGALYRECCVSNSITLLHGKLYGCPFSAHLNNLYAAPREHDDVIEVLDSNMDVSLLRERIANLLGGREYLAACGYCSGRSHRSKLIPPAIQAGEPLSYERIR